MPPKKGAGTRPTPTESTGAIEHGEQREEGGGSGEGGPTENKLKEARVSAKLAIHPSANAAMVIKEFCDHFWGLDLAALTLELSDGMNDVSKNDLRPGQVRTQPEPQENHVNLPQETIRP